MLSTSFLWPVRVRRHTSVSMSCKQGSSQYIHSWASGHASSVNLAAATKFIQVEHSFYQPFDRCFPLALS